MKNLMRCLSVLVLLGLIARPAHASFTLNNNAGCNTGTASCTVTISIASGHTAALCGFGKNGGTSAGAVTDSAGTNTWTIATASLENIATNFTAVCAYSTLSASVTSITYTPSGTAVNSVASVWDLTGTATILYGGGGFNFYNFNTVTTTNGTLTSTIPISSTDGFIVSLIIDGSSGNPVSGTGFTMDFAPSFTGIVSEHGTISASAPALYTESNAGNFAVLTGIAFQIGGSSCTNSGYTSAGASATPNGSSGSYVGNAGAFVTPDCSTIHYWQPAGAFGVN
jgi:hypothetical protein